MSKEVAKAKTKEKSSETLFTPLFSSMKKEKEKIGFTNKFSFPLFNINEAYIKFYNIISKEECFSFFLVDDINKNTHIFF